MNLDELQSIRDRERQSDSLQQLRETFYEDAGELLGELRAEREQAAARADDPFDAPEVNRLTDDIKTAEQTVEAIYERRVGKLVKMASFAAADMPTEDEGLTVEERELFEHLVEAIEHNRDHVLGVLDGDDDSGSAVPGGLPGSDAESAGATGQPQGSSEPEQPAGSPDAEQSRETPPEPERPPGGEDTTPASAAAESVDAADLMAGDTGGKSGAGESTTSSADTTPAETAENGEVPERMDEETPSPEETAGDDQVTDATASDGPTPDATASEAETGEAEPSSSHGQSEEDGNDLPTDLGQDEPVTISRETVKITREVGEIYGVDERNYDLSADDVVTLPEANVDPLVERDAAERLE